MRKLVLYIAMSLDGYIADENGGVGWLAGQDGDTDEMGSYPEFIKTVDTVIMGWTTYNQLVTELSPDRWFYTGMQTYVLTHRRMDDLPEIAFTDESASALSERLRLTSGKDIWLCGGSKLVRQFLAAGLIDRFHITVIPTLLGGGVRLFEGGAPEIELKLVSTAVYNGMTDLVYERRTEQKAEGKHETK